MKKQIAFWICLVVAILLFIIGFFTPPIGMIDGSVITAVGILFGFATLGQIPVIISVAKSAKVKHGETTIELEAKEIEDEKAIEVIP